MNITIWERQSPDWHLIAATKRKPIRRLAFPGAALLCTVLFLVFGAQNAQALTEDYKLTATKAPSFGSSVSVDGDTMLIGAEFGDDPIRFPGSAYVFTRSDGVWTQQAKLTASDGAKDDRFGYAVSISGDIAVVGAYRDDDGGVDSGSAYVFTRSGAVWSQQAKLTASDAAAAELFGVSISLDGDTALIGAHTNNDPGSNGSAYVFTCNGGLWTQQAKLTASDGAIRDSFGYSVSVNGNTAVIGAIGDDNDGSAYVFTRSAGIWMQQAKLIPSDFESIDNGFGISVSIDGDTVIIGAHGDGFSHSLRSTGSAYIFTRSGDLWTQQAKLTERGAAHRDYFGSSVSISGDTALIGAAGDNFGITDTGSAYIFIRNGGAWKLQEKLAASDAATKHFIGNSVSVSGGTVVVAARQIGSAYVFELQYHKADRDGNYSISFSEIMRVIQLYNIGSLYCDALGEDGFNPGVGDTSCTPHSGDYNPQDWTIDFEELLRLIQLYNADRYYSCPGVGEDGFCPGMP